MNTENSTPEWFQMAQGDGFEPKPKGKRALRIMALTAPLFVLGAGLVFAQTQESPTAVASGVATTASASSSSTAPISLSTPAPTAPSAGNTVQVAQTSSATPTAKASITIKKPAITMPTGGGEDDGLRTSDDD